MSERRKKIAVVAADAFNDYINRIFVGISEQCRFLGYDVCFFIMAFNAETGSPMQKGEENIFSLIDSSSFDGVILLAGNLESCVLAEKIGREAVKKGMPVISADYDFDFCESIYAEDSEPFEMMTDHFIEEHNCRRIMCLTGRYGSTPAMSRLKGYISSMKKHGLEIQDGDIIYGDFWNNASEKLAGELINGEKGLPDAIVCANDAMAKFLCNALIKGGIRVPEDVRISGYDASRDAVEHVPSITTIYPDNTYLGARTVTRLHEMITGEKAETVETERRRLIFARTCGCSTSMDYLVSKREDYGQNVERFSTIFRDSGMLENLMVAVNIEELLDKISSFSYILNGLDTYMLCIARAFEDALSNSADKDYLRSGYGDKMNARLVIRDGKASLANRKFSTKDIIPPSENDSEPSAYFILPVHFMERCFGYSVFKFNDVHKAVSPVFSSWNRQVSLAIETMRVRTDLMDLNNKINLASIRDSLTGIYNRTGFNNFSEEMLKKALCNKKQLMIIVADLDKLKLINDNYGHIEGDNAIATAAKALEDCCNLNDEKCARIGGDEYAVVGVGDYTDEMLDRYFQKVSTRLEKYNAVSGKGYKVGLSIGLYCDVPTEDNFSKYLKIADNRMYENKFNRRKRDNMEEESNNE